MGRIYIYKEKTKGGAPPGTTPPHVLVPRPHGLPMQRVRPCPTAEQQEFAALIRTAPTAELKRYNQGVSVWVGYTIS